MKYASIKHVYKEFLNTRQGADIYREFKRILYGDSDSLVQVLNTQILESLQAAHKTPIHICDVGGGDGGRILSIAKFLHEKFRSDIYLNFIEQSALYIEDFKARDTEVIANMNMHCGLFEDAQVTIGQFDLVLLIHSIFSFEDGSAMDKVLSLRSSSGNIIVVSNAKDSFLGGLKKVVDMGFSDSRYEIDDVIESLQEKSIQFKVMNFSTEWAIDKARWEKDIATLLDWITLGCFDLFDSNRKKEIVNYIEIQSKRDGDRRFFTEKETVLLIPTH